MALVLLVPQASLAEKSSDDVRIEKGKTPSTVFSIEVPGPSKGAAEDAGKSHQPQDTRSREKGAEQFFKDKQKQSISARPKVKEAILRLSGSLCPACLKALATRFQKTDGVISAKVELPSQMKTSEIETSNEVGKLPRYAVAKITFDSNVLTLDRIKEIVRINDLAFWHVELFDRP